VDQPRIFIEGLDHPEGLAFDAAGNLWAGGEAGQLYRIDLTTRRMETVAQLGGFCLGLAFNRQGKLLVCNVGLGVVQQFDPQTGQHEVFAASAGKRKLQVPNYPVVDRAGNLYISDSGQWDQATGVIYKFDAKGRGDVWVEGLRFSNGMALDAEERNLYVVQSAANNVLRIPIRSADMAGRPQIHVSGLTHVPDGLAFDRKGTLYVSCYGGNSAIYAVSPKGRKRLLCEDPMGKVLNRVTNLAFGGENNSQLFVANLGGWHLSVINRKVPGLLLLK
jgi:gluconolactonase